jgi:hypothetical protein
MNTIYKVNTKDGPIYMTAADRAKLLAYTKVLNEYERELVRKYGQQFNLLITPSEYNKAIFLHNRVNDLVQKVKRDQKILKGMFNR